MARPCKYSGPRLPVQRLSAARSVREPKLPGEPEHAPRLEPCNMDSSPPFVFPWAVETKLDQPSSHPVHMDSPLVRASALQVPSISGWNQTETSGTEASNSRCREPNFLQGQSNRTNAAAKQERSLWAQDVNLSPSSRGCPFWCYFKSGRGKPTNNHQFGGCAIFHLKANPHALRHPPLPT